MFLPYPTVVNPRLESANWPGDLNWRPQLAVASSAGDVVVTAGPSVWNTSAGAAPSYYFTVWRRSADGGHRFALDGSASMPSDLYALPAGPVSVVIASPNEGGPTGEHETALSNEAAIGGERALLRYIEPSSLVLRPGERPAIGEAAARSLLAERSTPIVFSAEGGGVSESRDLTWSYGRARWQDGMTDRVGVYARAWRYDGARWRLVLDYLDIVQS
jgi:hypothetical protein